MSSNRVLFATAVMLPLLGCNVWQDRAEFAAPQSRWPSTLPGTASVNAPPPTEAVQYCYRTLARVDCFNEAKPDRVTGYTGIYPDPQAAVRPH
jgi:hypothetical protein